MYIYMYRLESQIVRRLLLDCVTTLQPQTFVAWYFCPRESAPNTVENREESQDSTALSLKYRGARQRAERCAEASRICNSLI